ncbi:MAG: PIG-L deacetylase family protein [Hyphomicrobiaceae bacterium]|nr:PIG-L deacetylase family protein [Hyphomicrobiaceae bacterium]
MKALDLARPGERLSVLCLGAHSDDIEIGCGATLLGWIERGVRLEVHWAVLSATGQRADEARASAQDFLQGAAASAIELGQFRDGFLPYQGAEVKQWFEGLKSRVAPDVVLCHWRGDAHQDHREISKLVWNSYRNHVVLEYEIPKWDGDLGRPNVFIPATRAAMDRKVELLMRHFGTQRSKDWFTPETFYGLARLRGNECRAPAGYAEAFHVRKLALG